MASKISEDDSKVDDGATQRIPSSLGTAPNNSHGTAQCKLRDSKESFDIFLAIPCLLGWPLASTSVSHF